MSVFIYTLTCKYTDIQRSTYVYRHTDEYLYVDRFPYACIHVQAYADTYIDIGFCTYR